MVLRMYVLGSVVFNNIFRSTNIWLKLKLTCPKIMETLRNRYLKYQNIIFNILSTSTSTVHYTQEKSLKAVAEPFIKKNVYEFFH